MSGCTACHAGHATQTAGAAMLAGPKAVCSKCHAAGSAQARAAAEIARLISGLEAASKKAGGAEAVRAAVSENLAKARVAVHSVSVDAVMVPVDAGMAAAKQ
jgi:hypothetical protein